MAMLDENTMTYPLDLSMKPTKALKVGPFSGPDEMSCDYRLRRNGGRLANAATDTLLTRRTERLRRKKLARDRHRISWCVRRRILGDYHVMANSPSPTFYR